MPNRINPYNLFVGSFLPNWLLERTEISGNAKLVYARLCQFAGKDGQAFPTIETLAGEVGMSKSAVDRALAELKDAELIEVERHGLTKPNSYFFLKHQWMSGNKTPEYGKLDTPISTHQDTPNMTHHDTPISTYRRESSNENQLRDSRRIPARPLDRETRRSNPIEQINENIKERVDTDKAKELLKGLMEGFH